jgi:hypothetical protein
MRKKEQNSFSQFPILLFPMQTQLSAKCMSKSFKHPIDYFILGFYATILDEKREQVEQKNLRASLSGKS